MNFSLFFVMCMVILGVAIADKSHLRRSAGAKVHNNNRRKTEAVRKSILERRTHYRSATRDDPHPTNCKTDCPLDLWELCATDGLYHKTFVNECYMDLFNCSRNKTFAFSYAGSCM